MLPFPELVPLFVGSYLAAKYFGLDCVMSVAYAQRSKDYTVCGLIKIKDTKYAIILVH